MNIDQVDTMGNIFEVLPPKSRSVKFKSFKIVMVVTLKINTTGQPTALNSPKNDFTNTNQKAARQYGCWQLILSVKQIIANL